MIKGSILQEVIIILSVCVKTCEAKHRTARKKQDESTVIIGEFSTPLTKWTDPVRTQLYSKAPSINWLQLTSVDYFLQQQQDTHSSQAYMEHSPRQITFWAIKNTLTNSKEQKSQKVSAQATAELNQESITESWKVPQISGD